MGPLRMSSARIRLVAMSTLAGALAFGGLVAGPAARAAITASQITTPANPSFFVADQDASSRTFAISGTTSGGTAGGLVDINCYFADTHMTVKKNVAVGSGGSFSVPSANLDNALDLTCRLLAVPAGTNPTDLTPFAGPVIGVGERDSTKVGGGANDGKVVDYLLDAQQQTGAFDYASLGACGVRDGYLYDSAFRNTTITFACNGALLARESPSPTRSELQVDGANAYAPRAAAAISPGGTGLPALTETYTVDRVTGNVTIQETDPIVKCATATYPPTAGTCATFAPTGVTVHRTITQDHDGHISWFTDTFASTDGKSHSLDLLWDNSQRFWGPSGNSAQVEYEFPGQDSFATHVAGYTYAPPSAAGAIFVRMHGAADGDMSTGQGAIVFDRPVTEAKVTAVLNFASELTLHQTGTVPAGGSTRFRFAYVQDYEAALVAARVEAVGDAFLNTVAVTKSGKGTVTSTPGGIACGKSCSHSYAYGTPVTLRAKAARGWKLSGWSGACKGSRGCKVTANDDVAVAANFAVRPCVVPNVVGKRLTTAKAAIRKAFCSVGKVKLVASSKTKGRVVSQKPRHGKRLRQHAKIALDVSRG
jgi:List-Bact-rpt repeat protein/PASTA domain-containing protein